MPRPVEAPLARFFRRDQAHTGQDCLLLVLFLRLFVHVHLLLGLVGPCCRDQVAFLPCIGAIKNKIELFMIIFSSFSVSIFVSVSFFLCISFFFSVYLAHAATAIPSFRFATEPSRWEFLFLRFSSTFSVIVSVSICFSVSLDQAASLLRSGLRATGSDCELSMNLLLSSPQFSTCSCVVNDASEP